MECSDRFFELAMTMAWDLQAAGTMYATLRSAFVNSSPVN